MTVTPSFVWGLWVGIIGMQAGHALYLRSSDYAIAFSLTAIFGFMACLAAQDFL